MYTQSYLIIYWLYLVVVFAVSIYVYNLRKMLDEMHGMMVGMSFGMIVGLITSTLFVIPTGDFLYGLIIGSFAGLLFGIFFGKLGGHLGIIEGVIAGPMGGMMGAMLGQMVRPFDISVFMPFFTFIFLITMVGICYLVNCGVGCCNSQQNEQKSHVSSKFILVWLLTIVLLLSISVLLSFSLEDKLDKISSSGLKLPSYLQKLAEEDRKEAVMNGSYQEIDLYISSLRYSPNVIVAKKNILLRINLYSDVDAGCGREIVFPDFGINKIVPLNSKDVIEFTPTKEGEFKFRCSMDMLRGKLIVV